MEVEFIPCEKDGCGVVRVSGPVTRDIYEPAVRTVLDLPIFEKGMSLIFDLREADLTQLHADDFRHFAIVNARFAGRRGQARSALVVRDKLQFGMMRMYSTLGGTENLQNEIFSDLDAAITWATRGAS